MNLFRADRCLLCHEIINLPVGWVSLFSPEKEKLLCSDCEGKLQPILGETCRLCCRILNEFRREDLCIDCVRWEEDPEWQGVLERNISLYVYNDFLKEVIARFKYRGDYVIAKAFANPIKEKLIGDVFIPIPLSEERLFERGFNQSEALLSGAGIPATLGILTRVHTEKQSKKTRNERIHLPQVFQITEDTKIYGKKVVLIDDIYTTGSTLRHAAKLLKEAGAKSVESFTLARG
ncbi:ComF family protein [Neobacillus terrae]|uniref:ComF family protein n=1 Tax=Neobacillus terrae TaxID=3034837 RepID=UPI00140D2F69|nr:ComF family protein [Neobacillus terrae]NHM29972.1 ComF family protein [Neobacillus terrae]